VLVLAYRPALIGQPPANWQEVVSSPAPLLFTAGSPLSLFTLAQYQASGGAVLDSQGRPRLDSATLQGVLEFFTQAQAGEQMPFWLTQYETEEQVWQAYMENRSTLAVTWASHFLKEIPADTALAPLPTQSGEPFSLAGGWVWALTSPDSEQRAASAQLARFLAASDFAAEWSQAAGYLPTQPAALFTWHDSTLQAIASRVMVSAQRIPSGDILISLAPALSQATIEVLKQQSDARSAAEKAAGRVNGP
jgi:ABC-type glycerol-3-phosphate transport system substrate-binding protein